MNLFQVKNKNDKSVYIVALNKIRAGKIAKELGFVKVQKNADISNITEFADSYGGVMGIMNLIYSEKEGIAKIELAPSMEKVETNSLKRIHSKWVLYTLE